MTTGTNPSEKPKATKQRRAARKLSSATRQTALDELRACREIRPEDERRLKLWVECYLGVRIADEAVCAGHVAPFSAFAQQVLKRPSLSLWHGPRGSGKSFLSAIDTHIRSRFDPGHQTRILGGSRAQSEQIHRALIDVVMDGQSVVGRDSETIRSLHKTEALYENKSHVAILAASPTSVRGPHVPSLKLDEVDEIDPDIRESAMGMAMEIRGVPASVLMTSTWHRLGGPMSELLERGHAGEFPVSTFCVFEVLKRCPTSRSGKHLEKCPSCPLVAWCHEDRDSDPLGRPKAKRCHGHYAIDSLIQKAQGVSPRVFNSDYLCRGPRAEGVWFTEFSAGENVTPEAELDPDLPVHVAIDSGVFTGAVLMQVKSRPVSASDPDGEPPAREEIVTVFADYLSEGLSAERCALEIRALIETHCAGLRRQVSTDSAGGARNPVGPTVIAEYHRCGLIGDGGILQWPRHPGCVLDGLGLIENLVRSASGEVRLRIHPRCRNLIAALQSYTRARRGGQWMDYPQDPQHPHEDLIDALRGGLSLCLPEGRSPHQGLLRARAGRVF